MTYSCGSFNTYLFILIDIPSEALDQISRNSLHSCAWELEILPGDLELGTSENFEVWQT